MKKKYKIRLFIDDTCAFGVLGKTGRGIMEHHNCDMDDMDMIAVNLEYSCGAYGGFCTGTRFIIDHQRLSGLGYCFSASLPPLQAAFALETLKRIETSPEILTTLRHNCIKMHNLLASLGKVITVISEKFSPIKHLYFKESIDVWTKKKWPKVIFDNVINRKLNQFRLQMAVQYVSFYIQIIILILFFFILLF